MGCPAHGRALFDIGVDGEIPSGPLPADVLRYWRAKSLRVGFDYRDVWEQEHDLAFTAAKVMRADVLEGLRDEIGNAIAEGLPYERFAQRAEETLRKLGWWEPHEVTDPDTGEVAKVSPPHRLRRIFETNAATAHAAGQEQRIRRRMRQRPYLIYELGPSARHRPEHVAWHGTILPADDPWWDTHFPPLGWGCNCGVRSLTRRERDRAVDEGVRDPLAPAIRDEDGLPTGHREDRRIPAKTEAPPLDLQPWENKRTGAIEMVPRGIDPGFQHRPSIARQRALEGAISRP